MRKYGASAALVAIVLLILGAALWVGTGGIGHKSAAAKAVTRSHSSLPGNCIKLESGGMKLCTTDSNVRQLSVAVARCVQTNGASACGTQINTQLQQSCTQQGYGGPGCQRDAIRVLALVQAVLTGKDLAGILKPTGIPASG